MKPKRNAQTIIIAAGGTSGHIYPAFAIASGIREVFPQVRFIFCGVAGGLEEKMVADEGYEFHPIPAQNIPSRHDPRFFSWIGNNCKGLMRSRALLRKERPGLVIGTGGFVSAPLVAAARGLGIPYILHEQNAVPGRANRLLAAKARAVFISYEDSRPYFKKKARLLFSGNPVRPLFFELDRKKARDRLDIDDKVFLVLVMGGSLGSRTLNTAVARLDEEGGWSSLLNRYPRLGLAISTGVQSSAGLAEEIGRMPGVIEASPFLHDAPYWIAACDLFVGRAGAMTCAEIASQGKPSILVPFPFAVDEHQTVNARSMEQAGAAVVIEDGAFQSRLLLETLEEMIENPGRLEAMSASAYSWATPEAAAIVAAKALAVLHEDEAGRP